MRSSIRQVSENGIGGSSLRCTLTCQQSSRSNLSGIYPVCTLSLWTSPLTPFASLRQGPARKSTPPRQRGEVGPAARALPTLSRHAPYERRALRESPAAWGVRSDSERSEGIRVRGRSRESELVDKPPHPICFASQGLRSQIDLSPHAGRGGASGARALPPSSSEPYTIAPASRGMLCPPYGVCY